MQEDTVKAKMATLKKEIVKVERKIESYTVDDAKLIDKDRFTGYLDKTRDLYENCQEKLDDLVA